MTKVSIILVAIFSISLLSCSGNHRQNQAEENRAVQTLSREEIKTRSFSELFKQIDVREIPGDVFTLISEDLSVLTAGTPQHYNSMVAGWGGWGTLFSRPVAFSFLRATRYTLELIQQEHTYTMTFFDAEFRDDIMLFGMSSGRDSDEKMRNTLLTSVQTPDGNMTFKEAKLIIELNLTSVTIVSPDDFYLDEGREFVVNANPDGNPDDYHRLVFGEITNVWVRK